MNGYLKNMNNNKNISNNIKNLIQNQFSYNRQENIISENKKFEGYNPHEKMQIKHSNTLMASPTRHNTIIRNNSSSIKNEKKIQNYNDKQMNYPLSAFSKVTNRSISNNVSQNTPKLNTTLQSEKFLCISKTNSVAKREDEVNPKLTLTPSMNDRYNQYSPNKIKNNPSSFDFKSKHFSIYDNITNKKENFLIQSLNNAKSNFNLLENTKDSFFPSSNLKFESVKEFAIKEEQNPRYRQAMEDFIKIVDKFNNDPNSGLFALYDGHGGKDVALYAKEKFPEIFSRFLLQSNSTPDKALILGFQKIDLDLKNRNIANENVGTTASVVYITKEADVQSGSKRILYCANVGDSRVIILQQNGAKKISYDHRCNDINEINRIKQAGGIIFNCRVFGQLALTRAIGDHSLKKYGVIATPFTNKVILEEKDKYVVIASDGVWDSIGDNDVFKLSLNYSTAFELANAIVKTAISKGSKDNTSCIVIKLD
jgi:serine/threonine protein phosphatase PrpC